MEKILGCLGAFGTTDSRGDFPGEHLGARVATLEFVRSMIRYGECDSYHFMLGRGEQSDEDIGRYLNAYELAPQKITIYDGGLPLHRLKNTHYHVIQKTDPFLGEGCDIRRAVGHPLAPLVGMTHTVSNAFLTPAWMQLLLGHLLFCDAIVCTSKAVREVLERTFRLLSDKLSTRFGARVPTFRGLLDTIPLGVDQEYWCPNDDRKEARRLLELPEELCIVLCPARFSTYDKMDLRPFLMAVRNLLAALGPDSFRVVLAGDDLRTKGGESKLIKEFVEKLGLTPVVRIDTDGTPSKIRQYYQATDVFVSLVDNVQETFGLTVIQAMACGLPTIVSDWNGYKDTVVHGQTGFRVRTYWTECDKQISDLSSQRAWAVDHLLLAQSMAVDIDETFESLHALVTNPDLRHRFGQAGRKRAEELYAWPVIIKQYRDLWHECHERFDFIDVHEWADEDHACVFSPAYYQRFASYPSEIISAATGLTLSSADPVLTATPDPVKAALLPAEMGPVFRPAVFQALRSRLSEGTGTFGTLVEEVCRETDLSRDLIARHIMWLMKYGFVKPVRTVPPGAASTAAALGQETKG